MHESDHDVAGAERTLSKQGASFCSTFVLVFGQWKKRANPKIDPSAVIICHATFVIRCQPVFPAWRGRNAVSWQG